MCVKVVIAAGEKPKSGDKFQTRPTEKNFSSSKTPLKKRPLNGGFALSLFVQIVPPDSS